MSRISLTFLARPPDGLGDSVSPTVSPTLSPSYLGTPPTKMQQFRARVAQCSAAIGYNMGRNCICLHSADREKAGTGSEPAPE